MTIMIPLKGTIRDLFSLLIARQTVSSMYKQPGNSRVQIMCNTWGNLHWANQSQH